MKINCILAAVMSLCIIGGTMPYLAETGTSSIITANAADYTNETIDGFGYYIYSDHAAFHGVDATVKGKISIPEKVKNLPVTEMTGNALYNNNNVTNVVHLFRVRYQKN